MTLGQLLTGRRPNTGTKRYPNAVQLAKTRSLGRHGSDEFVEYDGREFCGSVNPLPADDAKAALGRPGVLVVTARREVRLDDGSTLEETVHRRFDAVPAGSYDREVARLEREAERSRERQRPRPVAVGGGGWFRKKPESFFHVAAPTREDRSTRLNAEAAGLWPERDRDAAFRVEGQPAALTPAAVLAVAASKGVVLSLSLSGDKLFVAWPGGRVDPATRDTLRTLAPMLVLELQGKWQTTRCDRPDHAARPPHPVGSNGKTWDVGVFGCGDDQDR